MTLRELREKRAQLVEQNSALLNAISRETNKARVRELEAEWDERDLEITRLCGEIEGEMGSEHRRLQQRALEAEMAAPLRERRSGREVLGAPGRGEAMDGFRNMRTGQMVPVLRSDQRLVDVLGEGPRESPLNVGEIAFRAIHGRWSGAEIQNEARAMSVGVDGDGGFMVPTPLSMEVIDYARAESRCFQAGVRTIPMDSATLSLARITSDPTWGWKAEGATGASSQPALDRVLLSAKTVQAIIPVTGELWDDAPNLPQTLDRLIRASLGSEIDRVILHGQENGSPSSEPQGIYGTANVGSYNYGGQIADYSWVSHSIETVRNANLEPSGMISHPKVYGALERLTDTLGQPLRAPQYYTDLARYATTNVKTDEGSPQEACAFVAKWDEIAFGTRLGLRIFTSREGATASDNAMTDFKLFLVAVMRCDVAVLRTGAVCVAQALGVS